MNWDAVGAVAELIGGVATVATLAYLAVQIRQNTKSNQAISAAQFREGSASFASLVGSNEQTADIYFRGLDDPASLSELETNRFSILVGMMLGYLHQSEELEASGLLSEGLGRSRDAQIEYFVSKPGFRQVYEKYRAGQPVDFAMRIDAAIDSAESAETRAAQQGAAADSD